MRERLRVFYSFPHPLGSPGIGRTAWHHVDELARAGHEVLAVVPRTTGELPAGVQIRRTFPRAAGAAGRGLLGIDRAMAWHDAAAARVLRGARTGFDVVHTWPAGGLRTIRTATRLGIPTFRELPNTHTEHAYLVANREAAAAGVRLTAATPHAFRPGRLATEMTEYAEATALLAPSPAVADTFLVRGHDPRKVLRHRYGFDPRHFREEDSLTRELDSGGGLRALFMGRVEPRKGLHLALRAWQASRAAENGTLTVCGTVMPGYREALGDLLTAPGVRIAGYVPDPAAFYAEHDVLLLPSVEEGSALVTYEASAMGCLPLVSAAAGAAGEAGVTTLVHPTGDWEALRDHLDRLVDDPELLRRMQHDCIAQRESLTWAAGVACTIEAYRTAGARPGIPVYR
ncbi:glycosyltransferase family 4 protein [Modestobacter sp. VKM Ac-2977]|uniref:glycosyltransferase family 4 protein n=1 Tax=Modestobacter sp. VKM Ac-2977 TaxID=3004131 RepID=UPI0022AA219A|nr:glycosyltransferase family 4 protein [Modestobacter sp. VKM Ac-2977]MCZ2822759.1 glycosyltransferase family 4 protein [Modestobacter sp. VKM Ac-2977]